MKRPLLPDIPHIPFRLLLLGLLLLAVISTQHISAWGAWYAAHFYPAVARTLSAISGIIPFPIGDLFIALSITGLLIHFLYVCFRLRKRRLRFLLYGVEYLAWIYVWFYLAWGLNYAQPDFYKRTGTPPIPYSESSFRSFSQRYIQQLNASYTDIQRLTPSEKRQIAEEIASGYSRHATSLGIHPPFSRHPQAKTMLFTPLASQVGVTGSMAPFFCEFTLNGDLLPSQYAATYAHELSHQLGIAREAEANFYAYQICTRSSNSRIRFSGYLSILTHVLGNTRRLLGEEEYIRLQKQIRPEISTLYRQNRLYWQAKYSPLLGELQNRIYDLYLKGNRIADGRKNYSAVVGLLIAYEQQTGQ